ESQYDGKSDQPGWGSARTLHVGDALIDLVAAGDRRVHALWIDGSAEDPIALDVAVESTDDAGSVRVAVLGPLHDGSRDVVAAGGYTSPEHRVELAARLTDSG